MHIFFTLELILLKLEKKMYTVPAIISFWKRFEIGVSVHLLHLKTSTLKLKIYPISGKESIALRSFSIGTSLSGHWFPTRSIFVTLMGPKDNRCSLLKERLNNLPNIAIDLVGQCLHDKWMHWSSFRWWRSRFFKQ